MSDLARVLLDDLAGDPAALERLRELVAPPSDDEPPELLTVKDTARKMGCSPKTVYRRIDAGLLPARREGGRLVIRASDLDRYIARLDGTGPPPPRRRAPRRRDYAFLTD